MQVERLTFTPQALSAIPPTERSLLYVMGHALNELNVLSKLFLLAGRFPRESRIVEHAQVCQALVLGRGLIGKLHEAWQALRKGYFGSKLSRSYNSKLEPEAAAALARLKEYFSKKNLVETVRNSFAFHYSLDQATVEIPGDVPPEELSIYFGQTNSNSLYQFAEYAMGKALLDTIDPEDSEAAFERMVNETGLVVGWFNEVGQGLVFAILDRRAKITARAYEITAIDIGAVPQAKDMSIPYFYVYPRAEHDKSDT